LKNTKPCVHPVSPTFWTNPLTFFAYHNFAPSNSRLGDCSFTSLSVAPNRWPANEERSSLTLGG
jgi:hypothetical protein